MYTNKLKISKANVYNEQTNAAGNKVVDLINSKRVLEVGIIPLDADAMAALLQDIDSFSVNVSFLNPRTQQLEEMLCIIPEDAVEYYTIQADKVMYRAFNLKLTEL
jgi:hypothetical protein